FTIRASYPHFPSSYPPWLEKLTSGRAKVAPQSPNKISVAIPAPTSTRRFGMTMAYPSRTPSRAPEAWATFETLNTCVRVVNVQVCLRSLRGTTACPTAACNLTGTPSPVESMLPDGPASHAWRPGFMPGLMTKDLDLAIGFAARAKTPLFASVIVRQLLSAA